MKLQKNLLNLQKSRILAFGGELIMEKTVVVRLLSEINQQSVSFLINSVETKLKEGVKNFRILLSSPGGTVFHGIAAYNFLKGIPAKIITHNFGTVDSIATVIYCAGTERLSVPNARFLIHGIGWSPPAGVRFEEKQLKEQLKSLEIDRENIAKIIAGHCKKEVDEIEKLMFDGATFNPTQAKEFGLVDEITEILIPRDAEIIGIG